MKKTIVFLLVVFLGKNIFAQKTINLIDNPTQGVVKENMGKGINSVYDELIPIISVDGNTLIFCRSDDPQNVGAAGDDIWIAEKQKDGTWGEAKNIGKNLNNTGNNSAFSLSPDGNNLFIMGRYNKDGSGQGNGISYSTKTKDGWAVPRNLKLKLVTNLSFAHFTMSADKKTIIVAYKSSTGIGESDLYVSFLQKDSSWSEPMNLGKGINTPKHEISPFLAADNQTLYFSSNGYPGYGSADVFVTRRLDSTWQSWSEPKNLGNEINTAGLDAFYTVPASGEYAYYSSTDNSLGKMDIFRIKLPQSAKPVPVALIKGTIIDKRTQKFIEAEIHFYDLETNKELGVATSNPVDGTYQIVLPYGKKYSFMAQKNGFYPISDNIDISSLTKYEEVNRNLYLAPVEKGSVILLNNLFFEYSKADLKKESYPELNRLVDILQKYPNMNVEISGHTDNQGNDATNNLLSQNRAKVVFEYLKSKGIAENRMVAKGYGKTKPVANNSTEEGRAKNRRVEFTIVKFE